MAANRWKIISLSVGGALLLLMLLASSFSLGVYVGEHGWTRDGLSYSGPVGKDNANGRPAQGGDSPGGPVLPGARQTPQPPVSLPPGRPNLTGRILHIQPQSLQVASSTGPHRIVLTPETRFLEQDGRAITLLDLQKGDVVAVYGLFTGGDGGELRADFIVRLPAKE
ncbi:MAG: hypothetical protein JW748_03885 [Anaerolineales bacterium]|nr:hypothetical protein [Anaerolineales bacterium]